MIRLIALALLTISLFGCEPQPDASTVQVVAFSADWCGKCRTDKPTLDKIAGDVNVIYVDIDDDPATAASYHVRSVPTYFVYDGDQQVAKTQDINIVWEIIKRRVKRRLGL